MEPIHENWIDESGNPAGGISTGIGFTISWQRGALTNGRNGAFLLEVLSCVIAQITFYQSGKFACDENQEALDHLIAAKEALSSRVNRRKSEGTLGTHIV